ncbi:MAG: carbohydrate-binding family 9-like protein [Gemmatimonadetes bacterium]|nr:carbohydrate-binding family 9-like protein [Gemmatimonadota bacterium]MYE17753.1 carbohydrate-binding family 9-like protein [Gemmatimonadota bacterium]
MIKTWPAAIPFWGVVLSASVPGASGQEPTAARSYDSPRASTPPVIDGQLTDPVWQRSPWTEPFVDIRGDGWPAPAWTTRAKIAWDDAHLYIAAELEEPHLWATLADRDAILYREHDFEVFLDPDGDALAYFELEINALGTEFDLFLDRPYQRRGKADIGWDMPGLRTAVQLDGTLNDPSNRDLGWSVEIAIPWAALVPPASYRSQSRGEAGVTDTAGLSERFSRSFRHGAPPRPGDTWRINFSRVQWPLVVVDGKYRRARVPTPEDRHPEHNWVWSPQGEINMHIPERWGIVRFVAGPGR